MTKKTCKLDHGNHSRLHPCTNLWSRITKNRDVSTGPRARPFARLLTPLIHSFWTIVPWPWQWRSGKRLKCVPWGKMPLPLQSKRRERISMSSFLSEVSQSSFLNKVSQCSFLNKVSQCSFPNMVNQSSFFNEVSQCSFLKKVS